MPDNALQVHMGTWFTRSQTIRFCRYRYICSISTSFLSGGNFPWLVLCWAGYRLLLNKVMKYFSTLLSSLYPGDKRPQFKIWEELPKSVFVLVELPFVFRKPLNKYFYKQWRPWWNAALCRISSASTLLHCLHFNKQWRPWWNAA